MKRGYRMAELEKINAELLEALTRLIEDSKYMRDEYSDMDEAVLEAEAIFAKAKGKGEE